MAKTNPLVATYSFVGALQADPVLKKYGDNSLPLFAIALHLDIEDLDGFATDCLTDHPSDKKADIIYINEAARVNDFETLQVGV
jgi:hypothetical protein